MPVNYMDIPLKNIWRYSHIYPEDIGIEVEIEGESLPVRTVVIGGGTGWEVKPDGSLRGNSAEYVLNRPIKISAVGMAIKVLISKMKELETTIYDSPRTAVHVHLNCQNYKLSKIFNIIVLYYMFEDILLHYCGPSREGNLYCLSVKDASYNLLEVMNVIKSGNIGHFGTLGNSKYSALNIASIARFGTLEFRALKTPTNLADIITWVDIINKIKTAALQYDTAYSIVESISNAGQLEFFKNIFGEHAKILMMPDIENILMDNTRNIQVVAYSSITNSNKELIDYLNSKNKRLGSYSLDDSILEIDILGEEEELLDLPADLMRPPEIVREQFRANWDRPAILELDLLRRGPR